MLQIYHGDGKGKTTAAVGLAVRAAGAGLNVLFLQFLKNGSSSEIKVLSGIDGITVRCCEECNKFTFEMNSDEKLAVAAKHDSMLRTIEDLLSQNNADVVIMDEFLDAYNKAILNKELAERVIMDFSDTAEIVLTGRSPDEIFIEKADYISNVTAEKHPYTRGITARKGIEY
ncbi:MAG: cob(I)yrinic acid a,c-diamide adenosyltransferase [Ruminococcus flavefaciens]